MDTVTSSGAVPDMPWAANPSWPGGARMLARAYDRHLSALWRGEDDGFVTWLAGHWQRLPAEPTTPPVAFCPHGGGGRGIRWHEVGDEVLGYVPGCACGYRIHIAGLNATRSETRATGGRDIVIGLTHRAFGR